MTYYKVTNRKGRSWSAPPRMALRYRMDRRTNALPGTGVLVFGTLKEALAQARGCGCKIYEGRGGPAVKLPATRLDIYGLYTPAERKAHWAGEPDTRPFPDPWPAGTCAVEWFSPRKLVYRG